MMVVVLIVVIHFVSLIQRMIMLSTETDEEVIKNLEREFPVRVAISAVRCSCGLQNEFKPVWLSIEETIGVTCYRCKAKHRIKVVKE
jgi:hypothetical protein